MILRFRSTVLRQWGQTLGYIYDGLVMSGSTWVVWVDEGSISKAGINGLTAVLASEWAKYHIRVNAVAPGWILTQLLLDGMNMGIVSEKQILAAVPMKRLANVSEIAEPVVFLASDEASYVTGQTLFVDGGQSALGLPDIEL